ncbi:MAG: helix-turn-helix domain-containing protein [Deltaproteobacteria bacterium]|nr:helix-turn-helix domain-containing protein [Deltaproteobacteria bacterium]
MSDEAIFLTANEGSLITGLHPSTLRKMAWERRIRSFKVLGALRFKRADLEALIVERSAKEKVSASAA